MPFKLPLMCLRLAKMFMLMLLTTGSAACTNSASHAPTMLDYSYIPPAGISAAQNYGIDDF